MPVQNDPQSSIYETTIEHEELEKLLIRRDTLATAKYVSVAKHREVNDAVQGLIATLDLGDGATVRVGNYLITRRIVEGGHVSFDRNAGVRYGTKLFEGEGS